MKFVLFGLVLLIELKSLGLAFGVESSSTACDGGMECHQIISSKEDHSHGLKTLYLNLRRYPRPGAPVIIMSHAVVLNNLAMTTLGEYFWNAGYDVWMPNMRAHGNGAELSRMEPYSPGDYHFDRIVSEDWPLVADYVFETTKQPLNILGYSMGGMTWEQYLSGVHFDGASMKQSDELAYERSKKVASFIALTVPSDLSAINPTVKKLLNPLLPWFRKYRVTLPFTTSSSSLERYRHMTYTEWARRFVLSFFTPVLPKILPGGILEAQNGLPGEFDRLVKKQLSSPHLDFVGDLVSWFDGEYESLDGVVNYGQNKKVMVPTLMIYATEDQLASADYCLKQSELYPKEAEVRKVLIRGFSHIDISFAKALPLVGASVLTFLNNPDDLCTVDELLVLDGRGSTEISDNPEDK
ncbi:MAG: alpha/beta fold hydrolase [Oligoflexales bacterium]|nr:alpha/beta fold hydrolase [Oligoflexales bacterium]